MVRRRRDNVLVNAVPLLSLRAASEQPSKSFIEVNIFSLDDWEGSYAPGGKYYYFDVDNHSLIRASKFNDELVIEKPIFSTSTIRIYNPVLYEFSSSGVIIPIEKSGALIHINAPYPVLQFIYTSFTVGK